METGCGLIRLSVTPSWLPFLTEKRKKWKWKMEKVDTVWYGPKPKHVWIGQGRPIFEYLLADAPDCSAVLDLSRSWFLLLAVRIILGTLVKTEELWHRLSRWFMTREAWLTSPLVDRVTSAPSIRSVERFSRDMLTIIWPLFHDIWRSYGSRGPSSIFRIFCLAGAPDALSCFLSCYLYH